MRVLGSFKHFLFLIVAFNNMQFALCYAPFVETLDGD